MSPNAYLPGINASVKNLLNERPNHQQLNRKESKQLLLLPDINNPINIRPLDKERNKRNINNYNSINSGAVGQPYNSNR